MTSTRLATYHTSTSDEGRNLLTSQRGAVPVVADVVLVAGSPKLYRRCPGRGGVGWSRIHLAVSESEQLPDDARNCRR